LSITHVDAITNQMDVTVNGTIDTGGYTVWVNGVQAANNGYGGWSACNVPVNGAGTALIQARAIPNSQTNSATGGGGGTNSTLQYPGNPTPSGAYLDTEFAPDKLPCIIYTEFHGSYYGTNDYLISSPYGAASSSSWIGDWKVGSPGSVSSWNWSAENDGYDGYAGEGFNWYSYAWNASGSGTQSSGWSLTDGNYTDNSNTNPLGFSDLAGPFLNMDGFGTLMGDLFQYGTGYGGSTFGGAADYDNSAAKPDLFSEDYDNGTITGHSMTGMAYVPGGKSVPVQYVVALTAQAIGAPSKPWYTAGTLEDPMSLNWSFIAPTSYTLAGLPLASQDPNLFPPNQGIGYMVVPSGSPPVDVRPIFDGGPGAALPMAGGSISAAASIPPANVNDYDQFIIGQNTYKEVIQVVTNGAPPVTLDPIHPLTFCVGQNLQFQLTNLPVTAGAPPLSILPTSFANWHLPDKYVNQSWCVSVVTGGYGYGGGTLTYSYYGSLNYTNNADLTKGFSTQCWYVNGPGGKVSAGGTLYFANGNSVHVADLGQISIYRPQIWLEPRTLDYVAPSYTISNINGLLCLLKLGSDDQNDIGNMRFAIDISSQFRGVAGLTQLIAADYAYPKYRFSAERCDGSEFYSTTNEITPHKYPIVSGVQPLDDAPSDIWCSPNIVNLSARDFVRFQPDGGIWVTLGITTWKTVGIAQQPTLGFVWEKADDATIGPNGPDASDEFPVWTINQGGMREEP